jgi:hypothetical protein
MRTAPRVSPAGTPIAVSTWERWTFPDEQAASKNAESRAVGMIQQHRSLGLAQRRTKLELLVVGNECTGDNNGVLTAFALHNHPILFPARDGVPGLND